MRALFIGFVWPEPKSSAAGQNILSYIETCLAHDWQVWFCSSAQKTEQSANLQDKGVDSFECSLNCSSFNQEIAKIKPDIVIFDRYLSFEQYAWRVRETCPNSMLVLDAEDLHFLRHARSLLVKEQKGKFQFHSSAAIFSPINRSTLLNDITLREMTCIYQADLTLVVSNVEKELLRDKFHVPEQQLSHIPFSLPKQLASEGLKESSQCSEFESKKDFMFIGNFRHAPNYLAAKVLRENIWPSIFKLLKPIYPDISCHVYGAYMSPKAKLLENKSLNFYMHGYTDNQYKSVSEARVMLAPISFGAGIKGKLIDAMLCNTPSVTTSIGAEGISQKNWPGAVCDSVESFIQNAVNLYLDKATWQSAVYHAKDILRDDFNSEDIAHDFINALNTRFENLPLSRKDNFFQRVLLQQQFSASKYMSQWIEAKNRPHSKT